MKLKSFIYVPMALLLFSFSVQTTHASTLEDLQSLLVQLQAQLSLLQSEQTATSHNTCVQLSSGLGLGATDAGSNGQVGKLQQFLRTEGFYTYPTLTGYYGPITVQAVTDWQKAHNLNLRVDEEPYGSVATRTIIEMAKGCESSTSPSIKVISPNSGAYWYQENAVSVSWLTSNIPRTDDQEVLIRLRSVQTGEEYNLGIATNNKPGSTATAAMAIPSTIPIGSYYVEVKTSVNGTSYMDASDEYIKIMANNVTALNADAAIKSTLMTSRAQAEIYWSNKMDSSSSYTGSYLGVCTASSQKLGLLELRNTIKEAGSETTCNDSSEAWAMSAPLMSNTSQNFCVDSTGQATVTYSQLGLSTSCIL